MFGSCRVAAPHQPPYTLRKDEHPDGPRGRRAARRSRCGWRTTDPDEWPHALLLLGDQVYADEVSPATPSTSARAATPRPPGEAIADFEEYTQLYRESWGEPTIRWLLSTVPRR